MSDFQADIDAIETIAAVPTILNVVCRVTGMGFAAVARVTEQRWVCLAVNDEINFGLKPGGELKVETTICHEVRDAREAVIIDHAAQDAVYCGHPTPAMYGFQSYISMPIFLKDGSFFGTLCAIDPKPAKLKNDGVIGMFRLFAELIAFHLDAGRRLAAAEANLLDARTAAEVRDQFIAVLGHDLRNPLASIGAGTQLLQKTPLDEKARSIVALMDQSVVRMAALITNILDFARGRLGGGLTLERSDTPLEPVLKQIIAELQAVHPGRAIEAEFHLTRSIVADSNRIGQLFSNLVGNALTYGAAGAPVRVKPRQTAGLRWLSATRGRRYLPPRWRDCFSHSPAVTSDASSRASVSASISPPRLHGPTAGQSTSRHRPKRHVSRSRCRLLARRPT